MTAGHCTEGVDDGPRLLPAVGRAELRPDAFGGWGGDPTTGYPYQNGVTFSVADNYGFHNFEGYPNNRDVGVVVLDAAGTRRRRAASGSCRRPARSTATSPQAGNKKQARFTISGYGLSDQDPRAGLVPRAAAGDVVPRQQRGGRSPTST